MAFIFWQPSDSSPPLFRPPLSELFSSGVETCLFRQNPSEAFHQKEKASEGFCFKGVSTPEKRRFEESGLASVTERPTGVKARKLRVFAQPFPSPPLLPRVGSASVTERVFERWRGRCANKRTHPFYVVRCGNTHFIKYREASKRRKKDGAPHLLRSFM